jgi:SAM-dependent methyltransferase
MPWSAGVGRLLPDEGYRLLARTAQLLLVGYNLSSSPATVRSLYKMYEAKSGQCPRTCPMCGYTGPFELTTNGNPPRWGLRCPRCGSGERYRLFFLAISSLQINRASKILHFAPEPCLEPWLRSTFKNYITADLRPGRADLVLDIQDIDLKSDSVDVILCSHVLEHVDDRRALRELSRILKGPGMLLAMVPIVEGWERTFEDPEIVSPEARWNYYGNSGHLRYYGADLRERVKAAGFQISEYTAYGREAVEYGLPIGQKVFICRKSRAL